MTTDANLHLIETAQDLRDLFDSNTYVVIDFFADWCGPCRTIAPVYKKLASDHGRAETLAFAKVNVDHVKDVAIQYGVSAMPTFMFFKDGRQVMVNGQKAIQGADHRSLSAAAEKLGGLAKKRVEEAAAGAPPATEA